MKSTFAKLVVAASLAGATAPAFAQEAVPTEPPAVEVKTDVPETVPVDEAPLRTMSNRTYLVIGLSTAAVLGLILLVVLLARGAEERELTFH